mmetsp:Transcript_1564/g.3268  ORF Transcript_1564/g.3268 Transcript_1564/m.3268 type:complete len:290 (-) Transcript_1564:989-1858(-)
MLVDRNHTMNFFERRSLNLVKDFSHFIIGRYEQYRFYHLQYHRHLLQFVALLVLSLFIYNYNFFLYAIGSRVFLVHDFSLLGSRCSTGGIILLGAGGTRCSLVWKVFRVIDIVLQIQFARLGAHQSESLDVRHAQFLVQLFTSRVLVLNVNGRSSLVPLDAVLTILGPQATLLGLEVKGVSRGRPQRRRVTGNHVNVLVVNVCHVNGKRQTEVFLFAVVAFSRPVSGFSSQDNSNIGIELDFSLKVVLLVAKLENRHVVCGNVNGYDNVVKRSAASRNVHVHVFGLRVF